LADEDLILAVAVRGLLPRHPGPGLGRVNRRPARHRRVLRILLGVDVQRRHVRTAPAVPSALTAEDPLTLIRVPGVVKPAREHVVVLKPRARRVLIPRSPRNRPTRAREVDRRRLTVLALVEVQRPRELRARARPTANRAVPAGRPRAVRERAREHLVG